MIDDAVLAAIAYAVEHEQGGGLDAALAALRRTDPLLRGAAHRRLRDAHADALLATRVRQGAEGDRHALRLTYLLLARALPPRAARDDLAAIEAAYLEARQARPAPRPGAWWPTATLTGVGLATALAVGAVVHTARVSPAEAREQQPSAAPVPSGPVVRGAYADGGVPAPTPGDRAIARALGTDAPDLLVALDHRTEARRAHDDARVRDAESEMKRARDRALAPEVRDALGPGAARALEAMLDAASAAAAQDQGGDEDALGRAAAAFDDELAAAGLRYFVDADVITDTDEGRRYVLVYFFEVERVDVFATAKETVRALRLRRLDKLNWSHTLMGFSRPTLRSAAVLLDQLDEEVCTLIAPALADGAPMALFEPDAVAEDRATVEAKAGAIAREEYGAYPGLDRSAATKLGRLLGKRRALVTRWEKLAAARGATLVVPGTLRLPDAFVKSVKGWVPEDDREELLIIDAALDDTTRAAAFATLREALGASVARHEVQHRIDANASPSLPMPAALAARVGPVEEGGKKRPIAVAARAELSAYLAELARDARTPRVGLTLVARFLFDARMHGTPESYAALTIFEGLAGQLGVPIARPLLANRAVDRHAVASVWLALVALPPARLREAAGKLWEALFAAPLVELRKVAPADAEAP